MWFFSKKKEREQEKLDIVLANINKFKAFKDIGEKFNYLGVEMIVTHYFKNYPFIGSIPELHVDYVNKHGEIKAVSFSLSELPNLIAENKED